MSTLREYLVHKRAAVLTRRAAVEAGDDAPRLFSATTTVEGRSGIRRIRIRDHQIISDSGPDFAGYDLGAGSPEIQLGVLGSCLSHVFLIQAADWQVEIDELSVEVTGQLDPRAGQPGFDHLPVHPHDIAYTVRITSPASEEEISALHERVERVCPIFNLLRQPQEIRGTIVQTASRTLVPA